MIMEKIPNKAENNRKEENENEKNGKVRGT